jgi:putative peptidoglycan lipid II flippase
MLGIGRAAGYVGAAALATTLVAFVKDVLVAHRFGASRPVDAFLVAFLAAISIPAFVVPAVQVWFTPAFIAQRLEDERKGDRLYSWALNGLAAGLALCGLGMLLASPRLIGTLAPGFDAETHELSVRLLRILLPVLLLYGVNELLKHALFCARTFFLPAVTQALPPAMGILGILASPDGTGILGLAFGWAAGSTVQTALLLWVCRRRGFRWSLSLALGRDHRRELVRVTLPYLPVQAAFVVPLLVDRFFASQLGSGTVSLVNYAQQVFRLPILVVSSATFAAAFPFLAETAARGGTAELAQSVTETLEKLTVVMLPLTVFTILFRREIITVVYFRGAFGETEVAATGELLGWFALGLLPHAASLLLDRALSAVRATPILMHVTLAALGVKVLGAYVLSRWMGASGLALSSAAMLTVWGILLLVAFRVRAGGAEIPALLSSAAWAGGYALVAVGVALLTLSAVPALDSPVLEASLRLAWGVLVFLTGAAVVRVWDPVALTVGGRPAAWRRSARR